MIGDVNFLGMIDMIWINQIVIADIPILGFFFILKDRNIPIIIPKIKRVII